MRGRSLARTAQAFLVAVVVVVGVAVFLGLRSYYTYQSGSATTAPLITPTQTSSTSATVSSTTTTSALSHLTLSEIESFSWLNETPSLGPSSSQKVIVILYDPECPYCAIELNSTLPFLYYISANTSQARVVFLGLPIHVFSTQMLEILDAVYNMYGQRAFAELLDENYAYYYYMILQYEEGRTSQLVMPTNATLVSMADSLGYNVTQAEATAYSSLVNSTAYFLAQHGLTSTPTVLAYDGQGGPVYVQVGLVNPYYIVCNLTEKLSLSVPGVSC